MARTTRRTCAMRLIAAMILLMAATGLRAQLITTADSTRQALPADTLAADTIDMVLGDSLEMGRLLAAETKAVKHRDWSAWRPDPKRAMWLAIILPGAGQIYNRKFWKLPIVYGGFVGCIYAMQWNNMMYNDYSRAYLDIVDGDPTTQSYNQFLHLGTRITTPADEQRYKTLFQKRKDYYRRYRDLSFFIMLGVYALSVIDAYVDASLSDFDISKDLSLKVSPTVINSRTDRNPIKSGAIGLNCSLNF